MYSASLGMKDAEGTIPDIVSSPPQRLYGAEEREEIAVSQNVPGDK